MKLLIIACLFGLSCHLPLHGAEDWSSFSKYHRTITRKEFCRLLDEVYNPSKAVYAYLLMSDHHVVFFDDVKKTNHLCVLEFCLEGEVPRIPEDTFRSIPQLKSLARPPARPLEGIRIVLDPGHIGGAWANMEERMGRWGGGPILKEGDLNLEVARHLKVRLEEAGAQIYMTHETSEPTTPTRPPDFMEEAKTFIYTQNQLDLLSSKPRTGRLERLIKWRAEIYFYGRAEIAQRAANIRAHFVPDLNLCIHFNASEGSGRGQVVRDNRHGFFINGCYGADEIAFEDQRFYMFSKLLEQPLPIETGVADAITKKMVAAANLPPVQYGLEKYQRPVNKNPYLYVRNLAATREYPGPSIFLEPFYMNNLWTAQRLAAGDYEGERAVAGGVYRSIFRDYADAVAAGVIEAYAGWTPPPQLTQ